MEGEIGASTGTALRQAATGMGQPQPWAPPWGWGQVEARPGCKPMDGHGRAVGSWRPALLRHRWDRGRWP